MDDGTKLLLMRCEWNEFFARNNLSCSSADFFDVIEAQHQKPQRFYHTFTSHVFDLTQKLKDITHLADQPDEIYFFLMTHDAVYDSTRTDNEAQSVEFAKLIGVQIGLGDNFLKTVGAYILASGHESASISSSRDLDLSLDLDVSILGASTAVFDTYEKNIRKEYSWVPEVDYRAARADILRGFLSKDHIYRTTQFQRTHQERAKENLCRSIDLLIN